MDNTLVTRCILVAGTLLSLGACGGDDDGGAGTGSAGTTAGTGIAGATAGAGTAGTTAGSGAAGTTAGTTAGTGTAGTTAGSGTAGTTDTLDAAVDSGLDAMVDAGSDSGAAMPPLLNGCSVYEDRTADDANRTLEWSEDIEGTPDLCIKIRAGQSVEFDGSKTFHPIAAHGGDTPTPFATLQDTYTFPNAGTFGYICTEHEEMIGVVWVVP